jgi:filamentous hemagglutinin family protein
MNNTTRDHQNAGAIAATDTRHRGQRFAVKALTFSIMLAFGANGYALPTGGAVSAGGASIAGGSGTTTITQTTQNVAINWQSFSIGQTEAVTFVQPNSSSVALNRVLGSDPSSIMGSLSANGKVFLLNPNGILFGNGAQVNVGGLVASTLGLADADFMAGRYNFTGGGNGTVLNQGTINAPGGYVALLGANVSNEGVIAARLGTVVLAAGNAITLDVAGDGLLNVTVNQGAVNALVQNGGLIQADGGRVLLTAQAAGDLLQSVVNNTGLIQAQSIQNRNGQISLLGDMQSGTVTVSGTLDVSGTAAGQTGGSVTVTAYHTGLFAANINASGDAGGGTVLVGGGYQGQNATVPNASAAYMSADSTINTDAINSGNGGTAVVWSNDSTRAYGTITAIGGSQSGNGGLIETSGHWLDVNGISINASAPNGARGAWLLDPSDVTISAGADSNVASPGGVYTPTSGASSSNINVATLQTTLGVGGAGTDVTITTTNSGVAGGGNGDITVAAPITWSPTAPTTLTLNAVGDVNINAAITTTKGNLVVCCGRDINVNALITTTGVAATPNSGGNVLLSAGRDVNIVRAANTLALTNKSLTGMTTTDGNMEICAGNNINLGNTFDAAALITLTTSVAASAPPTGPTMPRGLTLIAGTNGTGPGAAGGTLNIQAGTIVKVTGPAGVSPVNIYYNPTSYTTPTDYSGFFATGNGAPFTEYMLVFPDGASKAADGTTTATFTGLKGTPAGVTLVTAGGVANFDTAAAGTNKTVSYTGFTLAQGAVQTGGTGVNFALPVTCCSPIVGKTLANITAARAATTTAATTPAIVFMPPLVFLPPTEMAGLNLSVLPDNVLPVRLVETYPPVVAEAVETPLVGFVPEVPPEIYVPPQRLRKPDRN